jgi:hypothetical protein
VSAGASCAPRLPAGDSYEDVSTLVGVAPLIELTNTGFQHLIGVEGLRPKAATVVVGKQKEETLGVLSLIASMPAVSARSVDAASAMSPAASASRAMYSTDAVKKAFPTKGGFSSALVGIKVR